MKHAIAILCLLAACAAWGGYATSRLGSIKAGGHVVTNIPEWAKAETAPQGMTTNAIVFTNSTVKTLDGTHTVTASDVGAVEGPSNVKFYKDNYGMTHLSVDGPELLYFDYGINVMFAPVTLPYGTYTYTQSGDMYMIQEAFEARATFADSTNAANYAVSSTVTNTCPAFSNAVVAVVGGGGSPSAPVTDAVISYHADGTAVTVSVGASGTLSADVTDWTEGQTQTALVTLASGASVSPSLILVGYTTWPTGRQFIAACIRVGSKVYVNPVASVQ